MIRFLFLYMLCWFGQACEVSHSELWTCLVQDTCVNKFQLHAAIRAKKTTGLRRQFLMAVEGASYHKLFEDCDADGNGCLSIDDIFSAGPSCQRSCIWRQTMHDLLC